MRRTERFRFLFIPAFFAFVFLLQFRDYCSVCLILTVVSPLLFTCSRQILCKIHTSYIGSTLGTWDPRSLQSMLEVPANCSVLRVVLITIELLLPLYIYNTVRTNRLPNFTQYMFYYIYTY